VPDSAFRPSQLTGTVIAVATTGSRPARSDRRAPSGSSRRIGGRLTGWARGILADRNPELWGLGLVLLGLVTALGVIADRGGPAGRVLGDGVGTVVGVLRYLVPLALVAWGVSLLRSRSTEAGARQGFGLGLGVVALAAMAHAAAGPDSVTAPAAELQDGGGYLGAAVGVPLEAAVGSIATWAVLLAVAVFGLLVVFDVSLRAAVCEVGRAAGAVLAWLRRWCTSLVHLGGSSPPADTADHATTHAGGSVPTAPLAGPDLGAREGPLAAAPLAEQARPRLTVPTEPDLPAEQLAIELTDDRAGGGVGQGAWRLPPLSLLQRTGERELDRRAVQAGARALEHALASHDVQTKVRGMTVGPTVTRYELELAPGVKVARVTALSRDIAYAMAAADVRILAPIPGKSAIGVEVPNPTRQLVSLGDILATPAAAAATHPLEVALGQDISGRPAIVNLARMPHVLIAGATGSGKSSCINAVLCSILMRATPEQVRLILVDPKRVELTQYDRLPHLLTSVVTVPKKAANALAWTVTEMERRYDVLSRCGFRDIDGYNDAFDKGLLQAEPGTDQSYSRLPYILVVVDELNDLMMVAARDVEESICRIAQMARAVGIHLVIATQRPSVNVITGVIKANIPSRIAFAVSSLADSRVIIDQPGAERLVGQGDMLAVTASSNVPARLQGCWVGESEIRAVNAAWRRQSRGVAYVDGVDGGDEPATSLPGGTTGDESDDDLLLHAMQIVVESQLGSTSMLQRRLKVGFARAGRLMDLLEQRGVVGPSLGSKARDVLMTRDELDDLLSHR
jgi:DNA segregation ATPase FtsK/SpoIIIE, S-DNA-T family